MAKYEAEHGNKERQDKNHGCKENGHRMFPDQLKEHKLIFMSKSSLCFRPHF